MDFKDKVVWITGASSGIGEHLAYAFVAQGARLVLTSRNRAELERVKRNCQKDSHVWLLPADVTDFDQLPALAQQVIDHFGYLNILINNAGISQRSLVKDTSLEVDKRIMDLNFLATVGLTKAVLPFLRKQRFGHIVVMSSMAGKVSTPKRSAYCASKHALHGFYNSLRAEVEDEGIKITLICPGFIQTNISINALKGDGSANKIMDQAIRQGIEPEVFAQKALRAIAQGKRELIVAGFRERFGLFLFRFFPGVFARVIKKAKVT